MHPTEESHTHHPRGLERAGMAWPPADGDHLPWETGLGAGAAAQEDAPALVGPDQGHSGLGTLVREVLETVVLAVLLSYGMQLAVQPRIVEGSSMQPTLHTGQRVLVSRLSIGSFGAPQRGQIVVFDSWGDEKAYIKRVLGVPGDTVEMRDGRVIVNDVAVHEPYLERGTSEDHGPVVLGTDEYFVLGDNRANSADSRYFGPLPADRIIGRALLVLWPPDSIGFLGD